MKRTQESWDLKSYKSLSLTITTISTCNNTSIGDRGCFLFSHRSLFLVLQFLDPRLQPRGVERLRFAGPVARRRLARHATRIANEGGAGFLVGKHGYAYFAVGQHCYPRKVAVTA